MDKNRTYTSGKTLQRCVSDCEKAVILHVLLKTNGDLSLAAELLGIKESSLKEKINLYAIDCTQFE